MVFYHIIQYFNYIFNSVWLILCFKNYMDMIIMNKQLDKGIKINTKNDIETYINNFPNIRNHRDIIVDTLEEALQVAEKYKVNNKFDLFRGQSGLWSLIPTANRISEEERVKSEKALFRLDTWARENNISTDNDYVEGIAQHYGMKTLFLDFTTDPKIAAYFASKKSGYEPNEYGCIWCLNTKGFVTIQNPTSKTV